MPAWKNVTLILLWSLSCVANTHSAQFVANHQVTKFPPHPAQQQPGDQQLTNENTAAVALVTASHRAKPPSFLSGVILISMSNMAINWLRPDPDISWETRIPRLMWESLILFTASSTKAMPDSPLSYLLLSLMLGCTALIDIFFWGPIFGFAASFGNKDCSGGWFSRRPYVCVSNPSLDYIKGYGRLFVTFQCLFTGVFYLKCAIESWGEYTNQRDQLKAERQARLFQQYLHHQR